MTSDSSPDSSAGRLDRAPCQPAWTRRGRRARLTVLRPRQLPASQAPRTAPDLWQWTDDTEMACSVVAVLAAHRRIDQDALAQSFAEHHDFDRGYGPAVNRLLRLVREGGDWRELSAALFDGRGSWGNGAAMRIAPLGAWYADDPEQATHQAEISAYPTHQHREAVVGSMAVAAAAALASAPGGPPSAERRAPRRRHRARAEERRRRGPAPRPGHARLRRSGHRRGRPWLRTPYVRSRHGALRTLVGRAWPRGLRAGVLGHRPGRRRRGHDLRHRGRCDRRRGGGAPPAGWLERTEALPGWVRASV